MKKIGYILPLVLTVLVACNHSDKQTGQDTVSENATAPATSDPAHNSRNSLDWEGRYTGKTPCADCDGIKVDLMLNSDLTYALSSTYQGKSDVPFRAKGTFGWSDDGSRIELDTEGDNRQYLVGENRLIMLDMDGEPITGDLAAMYVLQKSPIQKGLEGPQWVLVELNSIAYKAEDGSKPAFLVFNSAENRVNGSGGCNTIFGGYETADDGQLKFEKMASTMMACPDMETEQVLLKALDDVVSYTISDGVLLLRSTNGEVLARFEME